MDTNFLLILEGSYGMLLTVMRNVGTKDIYEVRAIGYFGASDLAPLVDFYLPIIGASALSVYLALNEDPSIKDKTLVLCHDELFAKLQLSPGQFSAALSPLEAIGLIKTFKKDSGAGTLYSYCLYSPKSPKDFLDDVLLLGTLSKYIGKESLNRLVKKYGMSDLPDSLEDVSVGFNEFFSPDILNETKEKGKVKGRRTGKIKTDFDVSEFDAAFKASGCDTSQISSKELDKIGKLCTLYGIESSLAGELASTRFSPVLKSGERIDLKGLEADFAKTLNLGYLKKNKAAKSEINSSTDMANLVKLFESFAPAKYLSLLQGNTTPASSDLKIISYLSLNMGLCDAVINVIVNYVLQKNSNVLSRPYAEKIAAALKREGIVTAIDAMNYLHDAARKEKTTKTELKPSKPLNKDAEKEISDDDLAKALASLEN